MLLEEHNEEANQALTLALPQTDMIVEDNELDEPQPPSAFENFLSRQPISNRRTGAESTQRGRPRSKRGADETSNTSGVNKDDGPMSKFCKS
jgi:hypothetical protein